MAGCPLLASYCSLSSTVPFARKRRALDHNIITQNMDGTMRMVYEIKETLRKENFVVILLGIFLFLLSFPSPSLMTLIPGNLWSSAS